MAAGVLELINIYGYCLTGGDLNGQIRVCSCVGGGAKRDTSIA